LCSHTTALLPALYKASKETPNHYTFTLKMATAMFVETLDDSEHSTRLTPESQSYTLNSSREIQRTGNSIILP
jgi:hypothetical protein